VFQQENGRYKLLNFGQKAHRGESDLLKQLSSLFSQHFFKKFFYSISLRTKQPRKWSELLIFFLHIVALFVAHFVLTYFCQTDFLKTFAGFSLSKNIFFNTLSPFLDISANVFNGLKSILTCFVSSF
jgi:hypothetical protein